MTYSFAPRTAPDPDWPVYAHLIVDILFFINFQQVEELIKCIVNRNRISTVNLLIYGSYCSSMYPSIALLPYRGRGGAFLISSSSISNSSCCFKFHSTLCRRRYFSVATCNVVRSTIHLRARFSTVLKRNIDSRVWLASDWRAGGVWRCDGSGAQVKLERQMKVLFPP